MSSLLPNLSLSLSLLFIFVFICVCHSETGGEMTRRERSVQLTAIGRKEKGDPLSVAGWNGRAIFYPAGG